MKFEYKTSGTCSRKITLDIENGILRSVEFEGGCNGNLKGISSLCSGMKIDDIIEKTKGIKCGFKQTSCPDQLANALMAYKNSVH
ncbi:MAG: TIGR03905 family TSCPD domain-containing protein [Acutalibacteraceae bacterium]